MEKEGVWSETFKIRNYEISTDGRVTLQSLCNYFQEIAGNHAFALGVGMQQLVERRQGWMLSRFMIQMTEFPAWRDEVLFETWPAGIDRLFAMRLFRIRLAGRVIGCGSSAWLLFDIDRRKPLRTEFLRDLAVDGPSLDIDTSLRQKIDLPTQFIRERAFTARMSDLDINRHVNNVSYIDWALEAAPPDVRNVCKPHRLYIEFLSECGEGEQVVSKCAPDGNDGEHGFTHAVCRAGDNTVVAAATTHWKAL